MQGLIHRRSKPAIFTGHLNILNTAIREIKHSHSFHQPPTPLRPARLSTAKLFSGSDGNITQIASEANFLAPTGHSLRKALVGGAPSKRREWFHVAAHLGNYARLVESVDKCLQ
ncbi:hypothetical protein PEX1_000330 [Penicillium expansum]|uniref:Uncharacterized protein n=1 Tax=Penicillium expansum TaxID=27334 RepID=A0A0A2JTL8_PENEN|nr:hypothetical protein PEX2_050630 [Penicillium expansum]KGO45193.1 hypothetical protein PEX1_000330 [Penicillium expansum]KGO48489.1 hypothetical protein PEXP_072190 [Penicillium expansum]KGO55575.1 hypothetical protein PEX2_050630 [Penicillium expansum]